MKYVARFGSYIGINLWSPKYIAIDSPDKITIQ